MAKKIRPSTSRGLNSGRKIRPSTSRGSSKNNSDNNFLIIMLAIITALIIVGWSPVMKAIKENGGKQQTTNKEKLITRVQKLLLESDELFKIGKFSQAKNNLEQVISLNSDKKYTEVAQKKLPQISLFAKIEKRNPYEDTGEPLEVRKNNFNKQKSKNKGTAIELWHLAQFAYKNGLKEMAVSPLKQAWRKDKELEKTIYEAKANKILDEAFSDKKLHRDEESIKKLRSIIAEYGKSKAAQTAQTVLAKQALLTQKHKQSQTSTKDKHPKNKNADATPSGILAVLRAAERKPVEEPEPATPEPDTSKPETYTDATSNSYSIYKSTPIKNMIKDKSKSKPEQKIEPEIIIEEQKPKKLKPIVVDVSNIKDPLERKAEKAYLTALRLFTRGSFYPDVIKGKKMINKARSLIDESIIHFKKLVKLHPEIRKYRRRLKEANAKKKWSSKFNRVG